MPEMSRRRFVGLAATVVTACALCPNTVVLAAAPAQVVDAGALGDITQDGVSDKFAASNRFFLIRRRGRVYASSSTCTHEGRLVKFEPDQARLRCPAHGSIFDYEGNLVQGKARRPLCRYALKLDDKQHVIVDTSKKFEKPDWDNPAAFIALPK